MNSSDQSNMFQIASQLCDDDAIAIMERKDRDDVYQILIAGVSHDRMSYQIVCTERRIFAPMCGITLPTIESLRPHPDRLVESDIDWIVDSGNDDE